MHRPCVLVPRAIFRVYSYDSSDGRIVHVLADMIVVVYHAFHLKQLQKKLKLQAPRDQKPEPSLMVI